MTANVHEVLQHYRRQSVTICRSVGSLPRRGDIWARYWRICRDFPGREKWEWHKLAERKLVQRHGQMQRHSPLGKGWRNKYSMVIKSDVSGKKWRIRVVSCTGTRWYRTFCATLRSLDFTLLMMDNHKRFLNRRMTSYLCFVKISGEAGCSLEDRVEARRQFRQLFK